VALDGGDAGLRCSRRGVPRQIRHSASAGPSAGSMSGAPRFKTSGRLSYLGGYAREKYVSPVSGDAFVVRCVPFSAGVWRARR